MNVLLNIAYHTNFGEELILNVVSRQRGTSSIVAYHMSTSDGEVWTCNLQLNDPVAPAIDYYYSVIYGATNTIRSEWLSQPHRLEFNVPSAKTFIVYDHWIAIPEDSYQYSSAFTECLHRRNVSPSPTNPLSEVLRLKVRAPQLRTDERLVLVGDDPLLGKWDVGKGLAMHEHNYCEWIADINTQALSSHKFEYKFAIVSTQDNSSVIWEDRYNRCEEVPVMRTAQVVVREVETALFPIADTRCAGTLIPVFSLRSETSFGVGDFGDLKKFVDWVALTSQRILQILPINDTTITHTWTDSYPYCAISIFALHPQYADLSALPPLADKKKRREFELLRQRLNSLPEIDYEQVNHAKNTYLGLLFEQVGKKMMATKEFDTFFGENSSWLVPYAQYSSLRDKYGTADFSLWGSHRNFSEKDRATLSDPKSSVYPSVAYFYFVQFILHSQLSAVHAYARQKGVILKGDIPIGVSRHGCDVWQEPRYFNLHGQAGAPPDDFSANGQNWGFPTYNWDEMLRDDCQWWVRRFSNMAKFFDAYRIDHILGFFRIWEIPIDSVHGLLGQFVPSLGLSREEIEAYGLHFQEELFTEPFITDWVLERTFGSLSTMVRETFLIPSHDGRYALRTDYNTQRKIEAAFAGSVSQEEANLRDGLYSLVSDVLFVRDHRDPNKFHPRISVQFDFIYESLYDSDKTIFNKIYNDYYYHRNNHFWYRQAMNRLPRIVDATRMLVCGEDLGMVPECVPWAMEALRILSLELQSMPKDPHVRFGILEKNPYRSVCTISSHDTPTMRQWWDEDFERAQSYYNTVLHKYGAAPHPMPGWLAREVIARHLMCPSMLCILSLQDWLSIDETLRLKDADKERINVPANPHHYWRYRMHITIEQLLSSSDYNLNIKELIKESNRC